MDNTICRKIADKKKKRFLSMFTAVFMVFTAFGDSLNAFADRADSIPEIQNVTGNAEKYAELLDAEGAEDRFLGMAGDFTVFVKDKFVIPPQSADIEGRLAAGQGIENQRNTYDIGSKYTGTGATVIVGGGTLEDIKTAPSEGASRRIFAVSSDTDLSKEQYSAYLDNFYIADNLIDFDAEFAKLGSLSNEIKGYEAEGRVQEMWGSYMLYAGDSDVTVFNFTEDQWNGISNAKYIQIHFKRPVMESYVIFNVPGRDIKMPDMSVEFIRDGEPNMFGIPTILEQIQVKQDTTLNEDGTYSDGALLCGHILYNAPEAENVQYTGSIQGSLLAPNADVTAIENSHGHVSGSTIAKSASSFGIQAGTVTFNPPKTIVKEVPEVEISKKAVTGGPEIPGAVLEIKPVLTTADLKDVTSSAADFKNDGKVISFTSGTKPAVIKGLPDGDYTITEITSPDGYTVKKETVTFTVKDGKAAGTAEMLDDISKVSVSKVDAANSEEIPGAVLTLILEKSTKTTGATLEKFIKPAGNFEAADENKTAIKWTSGTSPVVLEGLPDGEYRLKETVAPEKYDVTGDVKFRITDGVAELIAATAPGPDDSTVNSDTNTVIMKDELLPEPEKEPSVIKVSKKEITGGPEIPGAKLTVTLVKADTEGENLLGVTVKGGSDAVSGTDTVVFVSGTEAAELTGLPDGKYTLTETTSPDGYTVNNETVEFELKDGRLASGDEAEMLDKPSEVSVSKMEVNGTSEIPGAVIRLTLTESTKTQAATLKNQINDTVKAANERATSITWTSGKAPVVLKGLPDGKYLLEESVAPDGYTVTDSIEFTITDGVLKSSDANVDEAAGTVVMRDELSEVKISKKEITDGPEIPGAVLKITLEGEGTDFIAAGTKIDAAQGVPVIKEREISFESGTKETVIRKLPDGKYTLTEITSPDGYTVNEESVKFEVVNGKTTAGDNTVEMMDRPSSVTVSKADVSGSEVPGAVLTLTLVKPSKNEKADLTSAVNDTVKQGADSRTVTWTSGKYPVVLSGIPDGEYLLSETVAPDRYTVTDSMSFTVEDGQVVKGGTGNKVQMTDRLSSVSVSKREITGGPELPGAKLAIVLTEADEKGATLSDVNIGGGAVNPASVNDRIVFISGETPAVIEGLPDGKYELTETTSPDGYTVNNETVSFVIENGVLAEGSEVEMLDKPSEVSLSKKAVSGSDEVPGAVLTLTLVKADKTETADLEDAVKKTADSSVKLSADSKRTVSWTSGTKPQVLKGLPDGEYLLEESVAPDGYTVTDAVSFVIRNGEVKDSTANLVEMRDELTKTVISKQTVAGSELKGAELTLTYSGEGSFANVRNAENSGAEITVTGKTVKWISGTKPAVIEGLPDGTYTLTEDRAPLGYEVAESVTFTVKNGEIAGYPDGKIIMTDLEEPVPSEVVISKTDISGSNEIPGAHLKITADDASADLSKVTSEASVETVKNTVSWVSGKTPVVIKGLPDGTYTLEESIAPDGYTVTDSIKFTLKDGMVTGSSNNLVTMKDAPSEIRISKRDINGTDEIPGAVLTVTLTKPANEGADLSAVSVSGGAVSPKVYADRVTFTSGETAAVLTQLPDGTYELKETRSPDGYTVNEETVSFEIKNGVPSVSTAVMTDTQSEVEISKTNAAMTDEVPGAELTLTLKQAYKNFDTDLKAVAASDERISLADSAGSKIKWTSGSKPLVIKGLPDGDYVLEENIAPDRYTAITGKIKFSVNDGKVQSETASAPKPNEGRIDAENNRVIMIDELSEVKFSKTDIAGKEIPGAGLKITSDDGKDLSEVVSASTKITAEKDSVSWVSEAETTVLRGLPDGTYTLEETQAPDGYTLTEAVKFTVKNGIPSGRVEMKDEYSKTVIRKTDTAGAEVPGAKLTLTVSENKTPLTGVTVSGGASDVTKSADTVSFVSGSTETVITGIPDGKYVLTETQAPEGFEIAESVPFTVRNGRVVNSADDTVTMVDKRTPVVTTVTTEATTVTTTEATTVTTTEATTAATTTEATTVTTTEATTVTTTEATTVTTTEATTVTTSEATTVTTTEATTTEATTAATTEVTTEETLPDFEFSFTEPHQYTGIPQVTDITVEITTEATTTEVTTEATTEATTTEATTEATTTEATTAETTTEATTVTTAEETTVTTTTEAPASTSPALTAKSISSTPKTGDTRSTAAVMLFMASAAAAMVFVSRRKDD